MAPRFKESEKILENGKVLRHGKTTRLLHWLIALSIFSLFFSGFGQMPMYKRYMLVDVPGMAWTGDYALTLVLHYVGAIALIVLVAFHLFYHAFRREFDIVPRKGDVGESVQIMKAMVTGKDEPPSHKYLAEQRLAYAFIGVSILGVIITGMVKVYKNLPGVDLAENTIFWMTQLHNITAMMILLGIVLHLAAFLVPANRKLIPSMFSGEVDASYVEHRHSKWWAQLLAKSTGSSTGTTRASTSSSDKSSKNISS
ncbi:formate dehydrogenase subunit gamma [Heliorestis convoluta]|uniref:Prokaryotic cytochrome b561 family protein n=1 Tax=Heliorestis convoluta TaxID=356322 RepID=A0A5Q2N6T5_9FIRM|nr:cytochrome b/b6 domain-containing protein [Heliorestis convoluta]QGG49092.1 prokaryotic cytochrome b561 family protein [Heliorestis convoluta]